MVDKETGAMQSFGARSTEPRSGFSAGLVLLYAEPFESLPAVWPLRKNEHVVGRESEDLLLPVSAVSRKHASFSRENGEWIVRDLGSRNGTLVNGRPISEATLENMDEVRIGDAIVKFVETNAELYAAYRIDGALVSGGARLARGDSALVGGYQVDRIASEIEKVARSPLNVMLLGESGTGKEVAASELHRLSVRPGRFAAVNCAAIPGNLLESELFGFKRGAFSGADRDKPGLIKAADGGTLLLDEIGDMPLEAQAKLLRVLQSREVLPLGATLPELVDVRVVAATHRDLGRLQREGKFREDLYARLNEYKVVLPPLYERKEDVYSLVLRFLERLGRPDLRPNFPFMTALLHYDWPYNVRELEACIKRCIALADKPILGPELLPDVISESMNDYGRSGPLSGASGERRPSVPPASEAMSMPAEGELRQMLARHGGNVAAVGRELGKARMQIHRWMKRYGIEVEDYRG
jgi:transcriptional regulator with PAS, ATPase and Fis domain